MLDWLVMFNSPWLNFCIGGFFLVAGTMRGRHRPPGSISSGVNRYAFAVVGLLLICNGVYLLWKFGA